MPNFVTRIIKPSDTLRVRESGGFIKTNSWGEDYDYDPELLLGKSDFIVNGLLVDNDDDATFELLVSMACVSRYQGCPDNYADTNPYFCCWATHRHHRGNGYGKKTYRAAIGEAKKRNIRTLFATTDNERSTAGLIKMPRRLLLEKPWVPVRPGLNDDEEKSPFVLFSTQL